MKDAHAFQDDPLGFLDRALPLAGDSVWLPHRQLCLTEASASRSVLANDDGLYDDHSDFFHTRRGPFGPRRLQVRIRRATLALLTRHHSAQEKSLPALVEDALAPLSDWPDAGNWLAYRFFSPVLVAPRRPRSLHRTVERIVRSSVLAGARERGSSLGRLLYRLRTQWSLLSAIEDARREGSEAPGDVLQALVQAAPEAADDDLAEVFLSFLFAAAGSVGFVLGWSVYLAASHPDAENRPAWVVREALRLWPVAWFLARRPATLHRVAGEEVGPEDSVVVCPYAAHRSPRHWDQPERYRPERWAGPITPPAFIPFGAGPHRCIAASLSMRWTEEVLRLLLERYALKLVSSQTRPQVGPALAPPRFSLELEPLPPRPPERR
ncbi:MAG: cytochrome P450 [Acidobacteria bacterium]|nr:cytochrome P450 [Acidobacteriota bacterium]